MQDMLDAFPNEDRVNSSNMRQFATAVAGLLHISDFQRRRITHMMRHYRDMRRRYGDSSNTVHPADSVVSQAGLAAFVLSQPCTSEAHAVLCSAMQATCLSYVQADHQTYSNADYATHFAATI